MRKTNSRRLRRKLIRFVPLIPRTLRHRLYRSKITVNPVPPKNLEVCLATSKEELEAAFRILHDAYVDSGFMKPHPSGMRVTLYHALPSTSTIIAKWNGEVVGTLSLIRDNPLGLPLDAIFETRALKTGGGRIAEVSSLAIKKSFRGNRGEILFPLLKYMYEYCIHYFGVDHLLIAVNPKHADFYEAIMFFQKIQAKTVKNYDFVNGAPAVGRHLNLRVAYSRFSEAYLNLPPNKDLFHYFTKLKFPNLKFPERQYRKISDPVMTPELMNYFFVEKTELFRNLTERQQYIFSKLYSQNKYEGVVPPCPPITLKLYSRGPVRFDVDCEGSVLIGGGVDRRQINVALKNVSTSGFCAYLNEPIRIGEKTVIYVELNNKVATAIVALPRWTQGDGVYGFQLLNQGSDWEKFITHLQKDLSRTLD